MQTVYLERRYGAIEHVLIFEKQIGGSLGGLAVGITLRALGHDTVILERNPTPLLHDQGAGIVAGGDYLDFCKKYNRCKQLIAVTSKRRQYLDKAGKVVSMVDSVQNMSSVSRELSWLG